MTGLRELFRKKSVPPNAVERWSVIQIEITSRCPLRCSFCPNKTLGKNWWHGDFPFELFRDQIAPYLARFDLAYLQGWGEPLLHPQIWEMVRAVKTAGCRVGFTTCASLLDETNGARLLDEGVDLLSISFAGATRDTHEALRVGSDYARLTAHIAQLTARKRATQIELHFLMMRTNIHELPTFVRLAATLGADQVVATNVTYAPTPEIEAAHIFAERPDPQHRAMLAEAEREARRLQIEFRAYPLTPEPNTLECDAQPTTTVFVNHRGEVAPCVYAGIPVKDCIPRIFQNGDHAFAPVSFGNVRDGLLPVMQGAARAEFVGAFRARKVSAFSALAAAASGTDEMRLTPAPPVCRSCYKMFGV